MATDTQPHSIITMKYCFEGQNTECDPNAQNSYVEQNWRRGNYRQTKFSIVVASQTSPYKHN